MESAVPRSSGWHPVRPRVSETAKVESPGQPPERRSHFLLAAAGAALAALAVTFSYAIAAVDRRERREEVAEISGRLRVQADLRSRAIADRRDELRREVLFLASVPPVHGLVRAAGDGLDHLEGSTGKQWQERLETILANYARTNPDLLQIRLIGVADGGRERIRVNQREGRVALVPAESLQRKGDRNYFAATAALSAGEVHLSDIDLERDFGRIATPHRPTLRAATPIRNAQGRLHGILVLNLDARKLLGGVRESLQKPFEAYFLDHDRNFLVHPEPDREFGFERGSPFRWSDQFSESLPNDGTSAWTADRRSPDGRRFLVVRRRIPLDTSETGRSWLLATTYPEAAIDARMRRFRASVAAVIGGLVFLGGLLFLLYRHGMARRIREQEATEVRIRELNADLERQAQERTARIEAFSSLQRAILANAGHAIIAVEPSGVIQLFNPAAESLLGFCAQDLVGKDSPARFHDPGEMEARARELSASLGRPVEGIEIFTARANTGVPEIREWIWIRADGVRFPVELTVSTMRDEEGRITGHLGIATDLTERRRTEETLRRRTEEAVAASRAKAEFLANMSHEIRTPMNAVMGLAYVLEQRLRDPGQLEVVAKIRRAGASLQAIIDDVLDFSKIEAGQLRIERAPFRLDDLLDNLATIMGANAGAKDIELVIGAPPREASRLVGDSHRLEQVLINLTGNALKFTTSGSVVVDIALDALENEVATLRFEVRDTGIGIPAETIPHLFSAFTQADRSTTRRFGGTGLGLAISKLLVEKMGGEIGVRSTEGVGSVFWFTAKLGIDASLESPSPERIADIAVLVADDNDDSRRTITAVAQSIGWSAVAVDGGSEAIRLALGCMEAGTPFDVLLLDWKMPDLDGLAVATLLHERLASTTPPIVLLATAHSREAILAHPDSRHLDGILAKPLTGSALHNAVLAARRRRSGAHPAPVRAGTRRLEGVRLLVADDNEVNRDVVQSICGGEGAVIHSAEDGTIALRWLAEHPRDVDVVLMDVQMPGQDGYTTTRAMRANPSLAALPVIALSAGVFESERAAALEAGMDAFVPKPFQVDELIGTILALAGKGRDRSAPPKQGSSGPDPSILVDFAYGVSLWKSEGGFLDRLRQFLSENRLVVEESATLAESGERDPAAFALHRLKGMAGVLGLGRLAAAAAAADRKVREGTGAGTEIARLREEGRSTVEAVLALVPDAAAPKPPRPLPAWSSAGEEALRAALDALDSDNRRRVDAALDILEGSLPEGSLEETRRLVGSFAFREAETALRTLARRSGRTPEKEGETT